jgi:carboxymethylenebutenolidase
MTFDGCMAAGKRSLSRRQALQLALVGLSAPALSALLGACHDDAKVDDGGRSAKASPDAGGARMITFAGPRGPLRGAYAQAAEPKGAVMVVHDSGGLTPHFVALAGRLAESGYSALSIDLLSEESAREATGGAIRAQEVLSVPNRESLLADLRAGVDELTRRAPKHNVGVIGFSLGAEMTWWLLDDPRLAAAVLVCGPFPEGTDLRRAKAAVLAMYAEKGSQVNATREAADAALVLAGLKYEVKSFLGVDNGFFDETGGQYDRRAADTAYAAVLDWFRIYLR